MQASQTRRSQSTSIPNRARQRRGAKRKHDELPRPQIVVRRPRLKLDSRRAKRWMDGGARTLILHALSPTFPGGERFFIKSVMAFKSQIDDPQLLEEMRRFAAQEALHTREHIDYDAAVQQHYDLQHMEAMVERDLGAAFKFLSRTKTGWINGPRIALAVTVALEHVTAMLGRRLLSDDRIFAGAEPEFARLWSWHAAEEIEHKAVAFDVFETVGGTWLERSVALVVMSTLLSFDTLRLMANFLARDGERGSLQAWSEIAGFLFVSPGVLRRSAGDFVDFFRPGFHPWDHDDRSLLAKWKVAQEAALVGEA